MRGACLILLLLAAAPCRAGSCQHVVDSHESGLPQQLRHPAPLMVDISRAATGDLDWEALRAAEALPMRAEEASCHAGCRSREVWGACVPAAATGNAVNYLLAVRERLLQAPILAGQPVASMSIEYDAHMEYRLSDSDEPGPQSSSRVAVLSLSWTLQMESSSYVNVRLERRVTFDRYSNHVISVDGDGEPRFTQS
jgi:hypothetical protein